VIGRKALVELIGGQAGREVGEDLGPEGERAGAVDERLGGRRVRIS
jgi:hypothetical protein